MTVRAYAPWVRWLLRQLVKVPLPLRAALAVVLLATSWIIIMYVNHKGLLGFLAFVLGGAGFFTVAFLPVKSEDLQPTQRRQ